jgi:hypothetical protein
VLDVGTWACNHPSASMFLEKGLLDSDIAQISFEDSKQISSIIRVRRKKSASST